MVARSWIGQDSRAENERVERRGQEGGEGGRDAGRALRDAISTPVKPITV